MSNSKELAEALIAVATAAVGLANSIPGIRRIDIANHSTPVVDIVMATDEQVLAIAEALDMRTRGVISVCQTARWTAGAALVSAGDLEIEIKVTGPHQAIKKAKPAKSIDTGAVAAAVAAAEKASK